MPFEREQFEKGGCQIESKNQYRRRERSQLILAAHAALALAFRTGTGHDRGIGQIMELNLCLC
jgi:hypothetical protein